MTKSKKYELSNNSIHVRRRRVAGGIATLVATGAFIGAGGVGQAEDIITNANAPHGRSIPEHPVKIENAGGVEGGTFVENQGNTDKSVLSENDLEGATVREFVFEGTGNNNLQAMTDTFVPDEDITEARNAAATYLPSKDMKNYVVFPNEHLKVVVKDGKIIPKDKLPKGYIESHGQVSEIGTAINARADGDGNIVTQETDQNGHTTTTIEQAG